MRKYIANITPERSSLILQTSILLGFEDRPKTVVGIRLDSVSGYEDFWNRIMDLGLIYINGVKYTQPISSSQPFITTDAYPYIFSIRVNSVSEEFPEGVLEASFFLNGSDVSSRGTIGINISTSDVRKTSAYTREGIKIDSGLSSFMLMRTNPRLTGNIKLVVTSDDKLYLDTFKVSQTLNDRVYRKYPVSSDGNYPFDVKTVFSRLPQSELFRLPKDSLNPHKYFTSYDEQYLTEYEYGAETSTDDMYTENMRILAPLHLGKDVPDFFCIFRYEGVLNKESYNSAYPDDAEKLKELIATSETVKIFDLRNYTAAGKYIRNYQKMISDFLYGSCYMQFIEQENADDILNIRQGTDSWKGIDVSKGIITNMMESSYFKTQVLNRDSAVQERFNNYVIGGYERNNVLYPYILNLEFMFNDFQDIKEFSMHRYFGLYLTENALAEYDSIIRYNQSGDVLKLDKDDNLVNDDKAIAAVNAPDLTDRIFFITTNNDASRIRSSSEIDAFISKYVLNNPDKHIASVLTEKTQWNDTDKSFITLKFTQQIMYGEHIRLVALNYKRDGSLVNLCLDFIASNDERLAYTDNNISAYIETNIPESHTDEDDHNVVSTEIYRVSFYTQSLSDNTVTASLEEQIIRLCAAIRKTVPFAYISNSTGDSIGIVSSHNDVWLQHILPVNKEEMPQFVYMGIQDTSEGLVMNYGGNTSS